MTYCEEESQSSATEPEFTEMVKLADNEFQTLLYSIDARRWRKT